MNISKELSSRVQQHLFLGTKKQAEFITAAVVLALEEVLLSRINEPGYSLKLGSLGKFVLHRRPSMVRKIPFHWRDKADVFPTMEASQKCGVRL